MNIKTYIHYFFTGWILFLTCFFISCKKTEFLNAKPQSNQVVPTTIADFQALLEADYNFNQTPKLGETSTDNYYINNSSFQSFPQTIDKNAYLWIPDIFSGAGAQSDWNVPYQQILYANIVLDGLNKIALDNANQQDWNLAYGDALFIRAYAYWNLAQVFTAPYDSSTANADLGLPLKLTPDPNVVVNRSTVQQTYDQVINDLKQAITLLPNFVGGAHLNRGSKQAAYALMARVALSMRNYLKSGQYADSCLQGYSTLIDYNTVNAAAIQPFGLTNAETLYQSHVISTALLGALSPYGTPDSVLWNSYTTNDLRFPIFFRTNAAGLRQLKYGYEGPFTNLLFTGLATDEVYLIRAECNARLGNVVSSMGDLNALLGKRWKTGTFIPYTAVNASDALSQILTERRKELPFRGLRWSDLRRFNKEGMNITLKRVVNGQTYTLSPNSPLWVLPIPPDEIALSGIQQNAR